MLTNSLDSVLDCLLQSPWHADVRGFVKFIGGKGKCVAVPGKPHQWAHMVEQTFKSALYCCEQGIDFWFKPIRGISQKSGLIHYGAEIVISHQLMVALHQKQPQFIKDKGEIVQYQPVNNSLLEYLNS